MNALRVLGIMLVLMAFFAGSAFASSAIVDFNINDGATYATSTAATLYHTITIDTNTTCTMCFSENSDANSCASYITCANTPSAFTLSSANGTKTVYLFVKDNDTSSDSRIDTITLDNNFPTYSVSGVADKNYYNTNSFTITITPSDNNAVSPGAYTFSGAATFAGNTLTTGALADGNYVITIDLNDLAGNRTQGVLWFVVDTNNPTLSSVTSSYTTSYTNDEEPDFTITSSDANLDMTGGLVSLSCSGSAGKWQDFAYAASISTFNITSTSYDCNTSDGNKTIYAKVRDHAGNWSSTVKTTNILYDNTLPSTPTSLDATIGDAQVTLTWTAPAADNLSGNAGYKVYKNGTVYSTVTTTTATVTGLTNGTSYDFKVSTYDNAGNESTASSTVSATPSGASASVSVKNGSDVVSYAKSGAYLTISCSFSKEVTAAKIKYRYYTPTQDAQTLDGPTNNVSSLSENITLSSTAYQRVDFWCEGTSGSVITSSTASVIIDNTLPIVSWVDTNNTFVGVKRFVAAASDNSYLKRVDFLFQGVYFATQKDTNNNFYTDINSMQYENGPYTIKAIATDMAGNIKELSRDITINNYQSDYQKAQKAISDAKVTQQSVNDLMNYFDAKGLVFGADLTAQKTQADQLLIDAQSTAKADSKGALDKATTANALYAAIIRSAAVSTVGANSYTYTLDDLVDKLRASGLSEALIEQARQNITEFKVERVLNIVRIGDTNAYQASISITFINDTNGDTVKIIEVIPKDLVDLASKIFSDLNFTIIQDDPIIQFVVPATQGATTTVTYGIGEITKEQADALTANNVVAKFASPPIILSSDTDTTAAFGASAAQIVSWILIIIGIIVVIAIIAGAVVFFRSKLTPGGHNLGGKKSLLEKITPEKDAAPKKWQHK